MRVASGRQRIRTHGRSPYALRTAPTSGASVADAGDEHVLDVEVLVDPDGATLAPVARLLDAAERDVRGADDAGVRADDSVLEPLGDTEQARVVARVEVR